MKTQTAGSSQAKVGLELDLLTVPKKPRVAMRRGTEGDIPTIYRHIERYVSGPVAPPSAVRLVMAVNPDNLVVFSRKPANPDNVVDLSRSDQIMGFCAMLMLSPGGISRLLSGDFKPLDPDISSLTPQGSSPKAIYQWMVVAPRLAGEGMLHAAEMLRQPLYCSADIYARPVTADGLRITCSLGFAEVRESKVDGLYRYERIANRRASLANAA